MQSMKLGNISIGRTHESLLLGDGPWGDSSDDDDDITLVFDDNAPVSSLFITTETRKKKRVTFQLPPEDKSSVIGKKRAHCEGGDGEVRAWRVRKVQDNSNEKLLRSALKQHKIDVQRGSIMPWQNASLQLGGHRLVSAAGDS